VQLQGIAEESLGAEGVETEDLPAFVDHASRVCVDQTVVFGEFIFGFTRLGVPLVPGAHPQPEEKRNATE